MIEKAKESHPDGQARHSLTVVVPSYNEENVLPYLHDRLSKVLNNLELGYEIIYVNDGSSDNTLAVMHQLRMTDPNVAILDLSRNFGKEIAMTAGLDCAKGDAVVIIDADLQDPPELIPELIRHWKKGYDVVYAKRTSRKGESILKKTTAYIFYRLTQKISRVHIPEDAGDYRLLSRRAVNSLLRLREQHRFMKGLFAWIGYRQIAVEYQRDPRFSGKTKWNYWKLWNFALEGITSFSTVPLKISTYIGLITAIGAFIYAIFVIYKTLVFGEPVAGFPTLIVVILFLGGIQLMTIGIIGEYLGRMFDEAKNRPLYLISDYQPSSLSSKCFINKDNSVYSTLVQ